MVYCPCEARRPALVTDTEDMRAGLQLQEKTRLLAEMEGEGSSLCRRVQELLQAEGGQRERVSELSAALDRERTERQALQERLEESKALLGSTQAQLRQLQQVPAPVLLLSFPALCLAETVHHSVPLCLFFEGKYASPIPICMR